MSQINAFGQYKLGDSLMPFIAKDINNVSQPILQFQNNLLLVSVWASNCRPCRRYANPWVNQMYQAYHNNGLKVYSISIETDMQSWLQALILDSCVGVQVLADNGWQNDFVKWYQINNIPQKLLFYKGVLIMKNNSIRELEDKIKKIIALDVSNK